MTTDRSRQDLEQTDMSFDLSDFTSVLRIEQPVAHIIVSGELDAFTAHQVDRNVTEAKTAGCTRLRIDLGAVTFIDAAGIGLLLRLRRTTYWPDETFEVCAASECVRRLCTLLNLAEVVGVDPAPWRTHANTTAFHNLQTDVVLKRPRRPWRRRRTTL
ncbi:hypothetical protein ASC77_25195 [Nocardioides sp. Root1257]|nr:hypothetical protein ASC77_25195 [Nocardioides sp. Root1257]KRC53752.1 hypothetical protein ASE24_24985 [Nocardioides sp. Root224]